MFNAVEGSVKCEASCTGASVLQYRLYDGYRFLSGVLVAQAESWCCFFLQF